jgi:hypothetical protein
MSNQHVVKHPKWGWGVKWAGNNKFTIRTETQAESEVLWRIIAKNQKTELFIHSKIWRIRERDSYWNDPHPPKG